MPSPGLAKAEASHLRLKYNYWHHDRRPHHVAKAEASHLRLKLAELKGGFRAI